MAEQDLIQVSIDKKLKQEVAEIYEAMGLELPTAIRMFFIKSKLVRGLPFDTTLPKNVVTRSEALEALDKIFEQGKSIPEMTLDEINEELIERNRSDTLLCSSKYKRSNFCFDY